MCGCGDPLAEIEEEEDWQSLEEADNNGDVELFRKQESDENAMQVPTCVPPLEEIL